MIFRFRSGPSCWLPLFYGVLHLAALVGLVVSKLPLPGLLLIAPALGLKTIQLVRCALQQSEAALSAVEVDDTGILLTLVNGRRIPVTIADIYCSSWLQVVQLRRRAARNREVFWLIVLPDTASADSRRQLRAWLLATPIQSAAMVDQARV